jgi:hypothetical protein
MRVGYGLCVELWECVVGYQLLHFTHNPQLTTRPKTHNSYPMTNL